MPLYQVIVLAIIQGLTEFLPVSSTAHLELTQWLFGWHFQHEVYDFAFDIALHAGTLLAVILYFFRDWVQIIGQAFGMRIGRDRDLSVNPGLLWFIILGTIPVGLAGLAFGKQAESTWKNPYVIGAMLVAVGVLMWIGEVTARHVRDMSKVNAADAGVIGLAQALAIVPGTSRSGITITAGLFRNLDRETAARFSFLLSTPAIAAAALKAWWDLHKHGGIPHEMRIPCVVGILVSGFVGVLVIAFLLDFLRRHTLKPFVYYRIVFGIIVIALAIRFRFHAG
ncbi:MAG TPA: undecaprenyl-diphosphate phosphatase [Bryobacteraceae bacterium]|nr:undecaprenyl-diphosphate phosphatase [Bryobacteraceae bacterium]